jgi:hypothetical protein
MVDRFQIFQGHVDLKRRYRRAKKDHARQNQKIEGLAVKTQQTAAPTKHARLNALRNKAKMSSPRQALAKPDGSAARPRCKLEPTAG